MSQQDVTELKRLISENKSEALEQKKERRQEFAQLAELITNLTLVQTQNPKTPKPQNPISERCMLDLLCFRVLSANTLSIDRLVSVVQAWMSFSHLNA